MAEVQPFQPGQSVPLGLTWELGDNVLEKMGKHDEALRVREEAEESRRMAMGRSLGSEVLGGLASGKAAFTAGRAAVKKGPGFLKYLLHGADELQGPVKRGAKNLGRDAILGGTGAGVASAGAADDPESSRWKAAMLGGAIGAGAGPLIGGLGRAIGRGIRNRGRTPEQRLAERSTDILEPLGIKASNDPPSLRAEKAQKDMIPVYKALEADWPVIDPATLSGSQKKAATDIQDIFDKLGQSDDTRSYVPAALRRSAGTEAPHKAPYIHHVEDIVKNLETDRYPKEAKKMRELLENHVDELEHNWGAGGTAAPESPQLNPDTPTGEALLDFLSQTEDLDIRRTVSGVTARLGGKPAGKAERGINFVDVQRTLAKMRDDMGRGTAPLDVQYKRADLEEAMYNLDPKFRLVQKQWGQNEHMHKAALAGQGAWKGNRFADRIKLDMFRMADDPEAQRAYTGAMFADIVSEMRYSSSGDAKRALDFIATESGPLKILMEELLEKSYGVSGSEALRSLRYAAQDEKFARSLFQRFQGTAIPLAAGNRPSRAFAYGMGAGRMAR